MPNLRLPAIAQNFGNIRNVLKATQTSTSTLQTLFQFVATTDSSPYYCVPAALKFRNDILGGEEEIYRYIRNVAQRGADLLAMILGTEVMDDLDPGEGLKAMGSVEGQVAGRSGADSSRWTGGLRDCAMANVLLPITIVGGKEGSSPQGRGSLRSGPGGGGSAGGLSPFGPMRRSPSPTPSSGSVTPVTTSFGSGRTPSLGIPAHLGHSYSKSSSAALPTAPARSPSLPLSLQVRNISPNSPFAPHRRSSAPLVVTVQAEDVPKHVAWMEKTLVDEFNTMVPIFEYKGRVWCRVSGQVYLELKDFEWLGGVLRTLCERVGDGESLAQPPSTMSSLEEERGRPGYAEGYVAATISDAERGEVERLRGRLGALDTSVGGGRNVGISSPGTATSATTASATGIRRFDVRVGRWVDS